MAKSKHAFFVRAVIFVSLMSVASLLCAQSFRGSIRGKIADPTGSLIAGAKVTAKNAATGLVRETVTGADGGYVLPELPVGMYTVTAEAAGLTPTAQNVVVNVGVDTTADFDLSMVQRHQEQLTVEATAPLVDAERDVLGEVVERRLVSELPLNGRDFGKLVALVPGATVEPSGVAAIQSGFGQFSINGNRDRSNNYELDGTDNNDPFFNNSAFNQVGIGGAPASLLPIDSIQEFNLQSHFSAEYGRNTGSIVNIVSRSGANQIHGSAFEFLRNDAMDARNFFNREIDPFTGESHRKSPFRNNNFGASIGGPIIHDRTFFFGAYEGQRERVTSDFTLLVPTQQQIADAQQFTIDNGVTPNPALTNILGFYPSSTTGIVPGQVNDKNDVDSFLVKIDHQWSASQTLTGRYAFARSEQVFPLGGLGFGGGSRLSPFAQVSPTRVQLVSASWLSTIGATKINEVRFGYSRYRTSFASRDANFDPSTLGIDFGTGKLSLPEFDFGGVFENLGASAFSIPRGRTSQSYQILDNFTWVRGRHTFKFGGEFRPLRIYTDRLGGTTWERAKTKVKKAMRDMAEELLKLYAARKAVAADRRSGADSALAHDLADLSGILYARGDFAGAVRARREAREAARRAFPGPHLEHAAMTFALADLLDERIATRAEAESLARAGLAECRAAFGDAHAVTAGAMQSLGRLLARHGRTAEAEQLLRQALALEQRTLGPSSLGTASGMFDLGLALARDGYSPEAERVTRDAVAIYARTYGTRHPMYAGALGYLANVLVQRGALDSAEALHREIIAIRGGVPGTWTAILATANARLADVLTRQGRFAEADSLYREGLAVQRRSLADTHMNVRLTYAGMATLYEAWGKRDSAALFRRLAQPPGYAPPWQR